jgi:hypothetical protein
MIWLKPRSLSKKKLKILINKLNKEFSMINFRKLKIIMAFLLITASLTFSVNAVLAANPPTIISYQGRLADSDGNLLGGAGTAYYFKISFYTDPTAGVKVWPSTNPTAFTATVRHGLFNINIGDTDNGYPNALNYDFSANSKIYLQVEVSSDGVTYETMSPRQLIGSSAFAQLSGSVQGTGASTMGSLVISGNSTTTNATTTGASYLGTSVGLSGEYIRNWSDLAVYLPTVSGWGTSSDSINWTANWDLASSSVLTVSTTSISSILALPNLSITKSQVSDFGSPLYSFTESDPLYTAASSTLLRFGTTSDALTEGITNKFYTQAKVWTDVAASSTLTTLFTNAATAFGWGDHALVGYLTNTLFDTRLNATTSLPNLASLSGLSTIGSSTGITTILGQSVLTNASTTSFTASTNATLGYLASTFLSVDQTGRIIATTTPVNGISTSLTKGWTLVGNNAGIASATSSLFITEAGKVGIGNVNPSAKLAVNGGFGETVSMYESGTDIYGLGLQSGTLQIHVGSSGTKIALGKGTSASLAEWMTLLNGNVGIGLTNPSTALSVLGTASSTALQVNGNGTITGTLNVTGVTTLANASTTSFTASTNATLGYLASTFLSVDQTGLIIATTTPAGGIESDPLYTAASSTLLRFGTTSDALTEGITNKFYTQAKVWTDVAASSTLTTLFTNAATAFGWGDHANQNYLKSTAFDVSGAGLSISTTTTGVTYTWTNPGYITGYTEADPLYTAASSTLLRFGTTSDALTEGITNKFYTQAKVWTDVAASTTLTTLFNNAATAYSWGDHAGLYLANLLGGLNGIFGNTTTTNATTSNLAITNLADTYLSVNGLGQVIATTTPTGSGMTNDQFDTRLNATTSLLNLATLSGLSTIGSSTGQTTILGKIILTNASTSYLTIGTASYLTGLGSSFLAVNQNGQIIATTSPTGGGISTSLTKGWTLVGNNAGVASATSSLFISEAGNVGIGTAIPGYKLDVTGDTQTTGTGYLGTVSSGNYWKFFVAAGGTAPEADFFTGGARKAVLGYDPSQSRAIFYNDTLGAGVSLFNTGGIAIGSSINSLTGNAFIVDQANSKVYTTSGINVGIGLTNPSTALSVLGTASSTALQVNGNATTTSLAITGLGSTYLSVNALGQVIATTTPEGASQWITSGSNIYYNGGNVGIGSSSPSDMLDVTGPANAPAGIQVTTGGTSGWRGFIGINNVATGGRNYQFYSTNDGDGVFGGGKFVINDTTAGENTGARLVIDSTGNVLIGARMALANVSPDATTKYALTLPNNISTGYGRAYAWDTGSDSRIKSEQQPIQYGLKEILQLQPKTYIQHSSEFKDGKLVLTDKGVSTIGLIAQEVYGVIPEAVDKPDNENTSIWGLQYDKIIPVLVKAVQELAYRTTDIEARLDLAGIPKTASTTVANPYAPAQTPTSEAQVNVDTAQINTAVTIKGQITVDNGINIKDRKTGELYCYFIEDGVPKTMAGRCSEAPVVPPVVGGGGEEVATSTPVSDSTSTPVSEPAPTLPPTTEPVSPPLTSEPVAPPPATLPVEIPPTP